MKDGWRDAGKVRLTSAIVIIHKWPSPFCDNCKADGIVFRSITCEGALNLDLPGRAGISGIFGDSEQEIIAFELQIELTGQLLDIGVIDDEALGEGESAQKRGMPVAGAPLVLISPVYDGFSRND
jgi:hypothetical protein